MNKVSYVYMCCLCLPFYFFLTAFSVGPRLLDPQLARFEAGEADLVSV